MLLPSAPGTYTRELKKVQNLAQPPVDLEEKSGGPGEKERQRLPKNTIGIF